MSCKFCFEDIIEESKVQYRLSNVEDFKDFVYCLDCLNLLINTQWDKYVSGLKKADCEKSLLALIACGPPINFRDTYIEENKEIYEFYYNNKIHSAKLKSSLSAEERYELHKKLSKIASNSNSHKNKDNNIDDFDYLGNIDKLLKEYNL